MKRIIATSEAPAAVGPYSQAVAVGNLLFCAGQIPLDPATGEIVGEDVTAQTERVCQNIAGVLKANSMTFANVVKATVFLTDLANFAAMNAVYREYFPTEPPTRATVGVTALAADFRIDGPETLGVAGLVNLFGIESPGITASLAIAEHVARRIDPP